MGELIPFDQAKRRRARAELTPPVAPCEPAPENDCRPLVEHTSFPFGYQDVTVAFRSERPHCGFFEVVADDGVQVQITSSPWTR